MLVSAREFEDSVCVQRSPPTEAMAQEDVSPIKKVVTLIEEMKATVEKEAKDDKVAALRGLPSGILR